MNDTPTTGSGKTPIHANPPDGHCGEGSQPFTARDGTMLCFRSIRDDDTASIQRLFQRLSAEEIRMRFQYARNRLSDADAHHLCAIDPQEEAAFVLMDPSSDPMEMRGVGRIYIDSNARTAEFAVLVERTWTGRGLGAHLIGRLVAECRRRGLDELRGQVLIENRPMLDLCRELGFRRRLMPDEPGTALISLRLNDSPS
jgi:RimJ/RimL family protein N-acetyltransferase